MQNPSATGTHLRPVHGGTRLLQAACLALLTAPLALSAPRVENPGFEADAFTHGVGLAAGNGGITGWFWVGNAGINPIYKNGETRTGPTAPFLDNGAIPEGSQTALLQNVSAIGQNVEGFEKGKTYVVTYRETARHYRRYKGDPHLAVTLGNRIVVPEHDVLPVDAVDSFDVPYRTVVSLPFTAPESGACKLEFATTVGGGVTVMVDDVKIRERVPAGETDPTYTFDPTTPSIRNGSFEYGHLFHYPGYAAPPDGITGWRFHSDSGSAGINPWWKFTGKQSSADNPFTDNGAIPHGNQAALLQNRVVLSQELPGLRAGTPYRVTYRENSRAQNQGDTPRLEVRLGGKVIVSPHDLEAVNRIDHYELPYAAVESASFIPPEDGTYKLEFRTLTGDGVTALIDDVRIHPVPAAKTQP